MLYYLCSDIVCQHSILNINLYTLVSLIFIGAYSFKFSLQLMLAE